MAYLPLPGYRWGSSKLLHAPAWVGDDIYDVEARVAPEDQAIWQQAYAGRDFEDSELLRSAIREALKERCKMAVHVTPVEQPYWNIVMGKHGATLKETVPGAIKPVVGKSYAAGKGFYIQDNGKRQFVGVSMDAPCQGFDEVDEGLSCAGSDWACWYGTTSFCPGLAHNNIRRARSVFLSIECRSAVSASCWRGERGRGL